MDDLKYIKKHYGENFAHLCRSLFSTILQNEGMLSKLISESFAPSRDLYYAVISCIPEFQEYIYSLIAIKDTRKVDKENVKTPEELLDKAGYILYPECKSKEELLSFEKYYDKYERLCSFKGDRLETCRVWFAVKKNVDEIKRGDFPLPERQDEYGTSVISIQCTRSNLSTLSIKNRYNHSVDFPDSTFDNNLDNIIEGLTDSFIVHNNLTLLSGTSADFELLGFSRANDGKFYKTNLTVGLINYCEKNIVINHGKVVAFDQSRYLLIDNYILDLKEKKISHYPARLSDAFIQSIGKIKEIKIIKDANENKIINITPKIGNDVVIIANRNNQIISYKNDNATWIGSFFLGFAKKIESIELENVVGIDGNFATNAKNLNKLYIPNVEKIGRAFLLNNNKLKVLDAPKLKKFREYFLKHNNTLEEINVPSLEDISYFTQNFPNAKINSKPKNNQNPDLQIEETKECDNGAEIN